MSYTTRVDEIYKDVLHLVHGWIGKTTTYQGELDKLGNRILGTKFKGVHAKDDSPALKNGEMCILNMDKKSEPGSHWVALVRHNGEFIMYDSFGRSALMKKEFAPVLGKGLKMTDPDPEQRTEEKNCGARCLTALLIYKLWGIRMYREV